MLCSLEVHVTWTYMVMKIVLNTVLCKWARVWLWPEVFWIIWRTAKLKRNQMIKFIVAWRICKPIRLHALQFLRLCYRNRRSYSFCISWYAYGGINVILCYGIIDCTWSAFWIRQGIIDCMTYLQCSMWYVLVGSLIWMHTAARYGPSQKLGRGLHFIFYCQGICPRL